MLAEWDIRTCGLERAGEAVGAGVGWDWLLAAVLALGLGKEPPMVAFSEMMLFEPRTRGCEIVVRRARGWIRLCSPRVMGCVPRM
jgi:hypothetical protein